VVRQPQVDNDKVKLITDPSYLVDGLGRRNRSFHLIAELFQRFRGENPDEFFVFNDQDT